MTEEVPYREVHELLIEHGWALQRSIKTGEELRRVYVSEIPGRPLIVFPVRQKLVLRAHLEKIKTIIKRSESGDAGGN